MPDQIPTADPTVTALAGDIQPTADLVKAVIAAIKAKDYNAAASELPRAVSVVQKDIADVKAAIPVIKSGWKTSEFWLSGLSVAAIATIPVFTHQPPSATVVTAISALAAVYAVVRAMVKTSAPK